METTTDLTALTARIEHMFKTRDRCFDVNFLPARTGGQLDLVIRVEELPSGEDRVVFVKVTHDDGEFLNARCNGTRFDTLLALTAHLNYVARSAR